MDTEIMDSVADEPKTYGDLQQRRPGGGLAWFIIATIIGITVSLLIVL